MLPAVVDCIKNIEDFTNDNLFATLSSLAEGLGVKSRQLFYVLRVALTGLEVSPGGATEVADILVKEETICRIESAIELLK